MRIEAEHGRYPRITPSAQLQRFQPRKQPSLSLIQQTKEQYDRRLHLTRQHLLGHPADGNPRDLPSAAQLPLTPPRLHGEVDERARDPFPINPLTPQQREQRLARLHVKRIVELYGRVSRRGTLHKSLAGVEQRAIGREPDAPMRPQAPGVEPTGGSECVVFAAVRIAREIGQLRELAEHGHSRACSQRIGQLLKRAHRAPLEQDLQLRGVKLCGSHIMV